MRVIAALPACALIAGAALGLASEPHPIPEFVALAAASLTAVAAWIARRSVLLAAGIAAIFFAGGALLAADVWQRAWRPPLRLAFEQVAERDEAFLVLEGTLRADASTSPTGVSLSLDVDACPSCPSSQSRPSRRSRPMTGGVLLTVFGSIAPERMSAWRAGRRVRVPATLRRASRYLDPGVPDFERALARRGSILVGSVKSGALVEVLGRGSVVDEGMARVRAVARRAIAESVGRWSARAAGIVLAIVIGDRTGLEPDVQRALQDAGTYHVIAISGGNIAILAGLLVGAFRFAGWLGRSAMTSAIALLVLYAMLVGGGASVDRATLMAAIYFAGRACDQRSAPLNTLAVAAGVLVAADPLTVADPAFILTFGATLGIVVVVPAIVSHVAVSHEKHESTKSAKANVGFASFVFSCVSCCVQRTWPPAVALFAASAASETMLFPVAAYVFSRVTFAGLALNFAAIPLMAVAQVAGMAVVPVWLVSRRVAALVGWIAGAAADGLVWSAELVRFAPALAYRLAPPSAVAMAIYYTALGGLWWSFTSGRRSSRRASTLIAVTAALWILIDPAARLAARGDGRLHVMFLDVGQGDAALVRFPRGRSLLVDAGGLLSSSTFDVGDRVVAPVLRDAGVRRLDYFALTHGDPDHIGGAPAIVREFRPREAWEGIPVPRLEPLTALRAGAQQAGARWANVYAGDALTVDDVRVEALHPQPADWERQKVRNDDSVVLELRWRDVSILLAGDVGKAVERPLASRVRAAPLRLLKVPHHGSITSSSDEFVAAVQPQVAVISVGRGNHFGHPSPEVIERYRAAGVEMFRTDEDGAISVETDGASITVRTFTGRQLWLTSDATTKTRRLEERIGTHAANTKPSVR